MDKERGDNSHLYPQFLPDGRHFLYLARNNAGEELNVIVVGSLDGGESKPVSKAPMAATYASGHLLFLRERTLMAQPFDTERRELTGEAVPIADDILSIPPPARRCSRLPGRARSSTRPGRVKR